MRIQAFSRTYRLPPMALAMAALIIANVVTEAKAPPAAHSVSPVAFPLSAEEIVARNVAARGGLEGWRKLKTMVWLGHIESERAPTPTMGFVLEQARPNKMRFQLIAAQAHSLRVFDGAHGWKVRPVPDGRSSVEPYTPEELRFAQSAPGLDGPLIDSAAKGTSVSLDGTEDLDGHKTYRLNVTLASGERDQVWVDSGSFLDVRYDRPVTQADGTKHTVTVYYLEYKKVEGLSIPSLIVTRSAPGSRPDRMLVERIALNAPLDEGIFANPGKEHLQTRAAGVRPLSAIPGSRAADGADAAAAPPH